MNIAILIPTYNAGKSWDKFLDQVDLQEIEISQKIIIDSGSNDETVILAKNHGFEILTIEKEKFDHGLARQILATNVLNADILVYLTQDCLLVDKNSISNIIKAFDNEKVGIAYGRQLPRAGATVMEAHARLFNYPAQSITKSLADKKQLGIKTASCSNSFAAYRRTALDSLGGFPDKSIFGEDVIVAGKMLKNDWSIAYVADAQGYHSHDYSILEEFKRYFDVGVFHSVNYWLIEEFGKANGEGIKYVKSEMRYVLKNNLLLLPKMAMSFFAKYAGYKLGMMHQHLPIKINRMLSMHKKYWQ